MYERAIWCRKCGQYFTYPDTGKRGRDKLYCKDCAAKVLNEQARERMRRKRERDQAKAKPSPRPASVGGRGSGRRRGGEGPVTPSPAKDSIDALSAYRERMAYIAAWRWGQPFSFDLLPRIMG